MLVCIVCFASAISLTGCGASEGAGDSQEQGQSSSQQTSEENSDTIPQVNSSIKVLEPKATGEVVYTAKNLEVDGSNVEQGYIMLKYSGENQKIKVQISKSSEQQVTYTYNLNARDAYEVFPLTEGDGIYSISVFENISGTKYSQLFHQDVEVTLENEHLPFLYPNQYVNFSKDSKLLAKGAEITKGLEEDIHKVEAVYNFAVETFSYDYEKAETVPSGYLPDVDKVLADKKGICFDYAAVMASMLRSQNIPCKLVVGYTGDIYHAWINVYTAETGWIDGMIFFDGAKWQLMDPTFASTGKKSQDIMEYISNPNNYQAKYVY